MREVARGAQGVVYLAEQLSTRREVALKVIDAKRDSVLYVLQKTMQRHRAVVSIALSFVVLLLAAFLVSSFLYIDAERAREAERLSSLEYRSARDRAQETAEQLRSTLYFSQMNLAGQSMLHPGGVGQMREILATWEPEQAGVDLRGWEWFLMSAFCHREQIVLKGHRSNIWSVDWAPDGSSIVSCASAEGRLRIWDVSAGEQVSVISGFPRLLESRRNARRCRGSRRDRRD